MKEIPGDSQRTGQVLTHQQDHYLLLYSRRSRMSTGRALHKNVLDTDIHTSRPMVWMSLTKQSITDFTRVASRLAPLSLKVNVLENVRAWRIKSVEKNDLVFWHFHNFLWDTVTEKIFTNVLIDVFTNILRAAFKVYSYLFIYFYWLQPQLCDYNLSNQWIQWGLLYTCWFELGIGSSVDNCR